MCNELIGDDEIFFCTTILNCLYQKWNKRGRWENWLIEKALLVQCKENVCIEKALLVQCGKNVCVKKALLVQCGEMCACIKIC